MAKNDLIKRMLDSGMAFTQLSQSKAEALTKELVQQGEMKRKEAAKLVDALVDRGRETTEKLVGMIQDEVAKQLARFANQIDDIEDRIEDLAERLGMGSKDTPSPAVAPEPVVAAATASKPTARKAAARKQPVAAEAAPAPAKRAAPRSAAIPAMKAAPASKRSSTKPPVAPAMKATPARKSVASGRAASAKAAARKPAAKKSDPVA